MGGGGIVGGWAAAPPQTAPAVITPSRNRFTVMIAFRPGVEAEEAERPASADFFRPDRPTDLMTLAAVAVGWILRPGAAGFGERMEAG
jgi:hypothetical protein